MLTSFLTNTAKKNYSSYDYLHVTPTNKCPYESCTGILSRIGYFKEIECYVFTCGKCNKQFISKFDNSLVIAAADITIDKDHCGQQR